MVQLKHVQTSVLDIAYEQAGPPGAYPVVLVHGFPYDARAFDDVALILNAAGFRTGGPRSLPALIPITRRHLPHPQLTSPALIVSLRSVC
jgi:pimeloyl-ACP methyl ester carboxylesterase